MLITGTGDLADHLEVVNLSNNKKCQISHNLQYAKTGCNDNDNHQQLSLKGSFGGLLNCSSTPVICGGHCDDADYFSSTCETLSDHDSLTVEMTVPRVDAASIVVSTDLDSGRLWITGGSLTSSRITPMDTTEYVSMVPSGSGYHLQVEPGPKLNDKILGHCLVKVEDFNVLLIGGAGDKSSDIRDTVWKIPLDDVESNWEQGPSLQLERVHHTCGLMLDQETGSRVVIVVGGEGKLAWAGSPEPKAFNSFEIWSMGDILVESFKMFFEEGGLLFGENVKLERPFGIVTEGRTSFVLGGGDYEIYEMSTMYHDLWIISCRNSDCSVDKRENILDIGRTATVAMLIPSSAVPCQLE